MNSGPHRIAVVRGSGEEVQELFAAVAKACRSAGLTVAGVVAETHRLPDRRCSAGTLHDIASGEKFPIYLETVPSGTSCHLDAAGVEAACATLMAQLPESDLVLFSKFGKLEAQGRGLLPAFRGAIAAGRPVITTVSGKHRAAWHEFAPNADLIEADEAALTAWWRAATAKGGPAARA